METHPSRKAVRHLTNNRGWFRSCVGQLVKRGFKHGVVVKTTA